MLAAPLEQGGPEGKPDVYDTAVLGATTHRMSSRAPKRQSARANLQARSKSMLSGHPVLSIARALIEATICASNSFDTKVHALNNQLQYQSPEVAGQYGVKLLCIKQSVRRHVSKIAPQRGHEQCV